MRYLAPILALLAGTWTNGAMAAQASAPDTVLTCLIEGQDREVSLATDGPNVTYRYGSPGRNPELTLRDSLADLDYRRKSGPGATIDEIVTFENGDTAYRLAAGFRVGGAPDPTALRPFATLTVSRAGKTLSALACRPDSIRRVHDRLLARMRAIGRQRSSDGETFPNYEIQYPAPAERSPPCKADFNVDTCWSRGVGAERGGDLRGALGHYDMSCAAGFNDLGCYEAGKLYLHNRQLRDYARAAARFAEVCNGDDPGHGPYACKHLGWMHLTATGVGRDLDKAWSLLARACFLHNDADMIDPEGCHFLARTITTVRDAAPARYPNADLLRYIALSQACTDDARTVCDEAGALYRTSAARRAPWVTACTAMVNARQSFDSCGDMARFRQDYDAAMLARRKLKALFLAALETRR